MDSKRFNLGVVLTVMYSNRLVPMDAVYDLLSFIVGGEINTIEMLAVMKECQPYLKKQFPELASPEMQFEITALQEMLKTPSGNEGPEMLVKGWLATQSLKYGETFSVEPLPNK